MPAQGTCDILLDKLRVDCRTRAGTHGRGFDDEGGDISGHTPGMLACDRTLNDLDLACSESRSVVRAQRAKRVVENTMSGDN
jgi:hypothetical protein